MEPQSKRPISRLENYTQQEQIYGSLSEELRSKINALINAYDPINKIAVKTKSRSLESKRDNRLPIPGSLISKVYKGKRMDVKVLENGFEYEGAIYKNLSAVAKAITGSHWNGFIFFGFKKP